MRESLGKVERDVSEQHRNDVVEYIGFGECGVAYELLNCVLDNQ